MSKELDIPALLAWVERLKQDHWDNHAAKIITLQHFPAALAKIAELQRKNDELMEWANKFENDEASVCPEDVGFLEYIGVLKRHLDAIAEALGQPKPELLAKDAARAEGWYWAKWDGDWNPAYWVARKEFWTLDHGATAESWPEDIGPRIPSPDEVPAYHPDQLAGMVRELRERLKGSDTRSQMVLDAKNLWMERALKAEREVAALRADKERLDWLEQAKIREAFEIAPGQTFREAIDAARSKDAGV